MLDRQGVIEARVAAASRELVETESEHQRLNESLVSAQADNKEFLDEIQNKVNFRFLGMPTTSLSFVIVIDLSESMKPYAQLMINTVERIVSPLKRIHKLSIIGYTITGRTSTLYYWPDEGHIQVMDAKGKERALEFAHSLVQKFGGGTPTFDALEAALKNPADAILLLSDGMPPPSQNDGRLPSEFIDDITLLNAGQKEIHAVALGNYSENRLLIEFLQNLAQNNAGGFMALAPL